MQHEQHVTKKDAMQRLRSAVRARNTRYKVTLQWRRPDGLRPGGNPCDWRDWRVFAVIPILFYSEQEAWDYIHMVDIFKNTGRKPSASVQRVELSRCKRH